MPHLPAPHHPMHLVGGQAVWLAWFGVVYAGMSVGCAVSPPAAAEGPFNWINALLLAMTVGTVAVLAWAAWCSWTAAGGPPSGDASRGRARFVARAAALLYFASAAAALLVGVPLIVLPPCV